MTDQIERVARVLRVYGTAHPEQAAQAALAALADELRDAERYEVSRLELRVEQAKNERLLAILMGIVNLEAPKDVEVNGTTYRFSPQDPTLCLQMWREMSKRIRELPEAIDAARAGE